MQLEIIYRSIKTIIGAKRNNPQTKTIEQERRIQKLLKSSRDKASCKIKLTQIQTIPKTETQRDCKLRAGYKNELFLNT
jgi:agmatine/peptidylarginine deiminase